MTRRPIVLYTICIAYVTTRASSPLFNTSNTQSLISLARLGFGFGFGLLFPISLLPQTNSHTLRTHNSVSLSKFFFFFFFYFRVLFRSRRANENNAQKYANIMRVYKFANGGDEVFFIGDLGRKGRLIHYLLSTLFCSILR